MQRFIRFNDWRFGVKIGVSLILLGILPVAITSLILTLNTSTALDKEAENELDALVHSRKTSLEIWLTDRHDDLHSLAHTPTLKQAMRDFNSALEQDAETYGGQTQALEHMRNAYIDQTELIDARDGSAFTEAHKEYRPFFEDYLHVHRYPDLILMDTRGNILFNVGKGDEFGTNLETGIYKDTNLALGFNEIIEINTLHYTMIEDFAYYPPTGLAEAFVLSPIFDGNQMIGVVAFHLPLDEINAIMNDTTGLGETGETYLVGPHGLMHSESRFTADLGVDTTVLNPDITIDTKAWREAFAGRDGVAVIEDYRGVEVLSAWTTVEVQPAFEGVETEGLKWAVIGELDHAEVQEPVIAARNTAIAATIIAALAAMGAAYGLSRFLTRQVNELDNVFSDVRIGEFSTRAAIYGKDELGNVADGVNAMLEQMVDLLNETEKERATLEQAVAKLANEVSELATGDLSIQAEVDEEMATSAVAQALNYAISELRQLVLGVENTASELTGASTSISDVVQVMITQASDSAQVAEQAASTARDGDQAVNQTIAAMGRIRTNTQETAQRIKRLGEVSQEISEFVRIIEEIADRTTVLALNASIQAAAAGDAGRGFAVVAEEVQRLAERSTTATREIEELVKNIQAETNQAVMSIEDSTQEVVAGSQLAQEAGSRMAELNELVYRLSQLIQETAETTAQQTSNSVQALASLSQNLQTSVAVFGLPQHGNGQNGNGKREQTSDSSGVITDNLQPQLG